MTKINISQIKSRFSHYAQRVKKGEIIVLCDRNKPFAEIRPLPDPSKPPAQRQLGIMKGICPAGADFYSEDREIAQDFENSATFPQGLGTSRL